MVLLIEKSYIRRSRVIDVQVSHICRTGFDPNKTILVQITCWVCSVKPLALGKQGKGRKAYI